MYKKSKYIKLSLANSNLESSYFEAQTLVLNCGVKRLFKLHKLILQVQPLI